MLLYPEENISQNWQCEQCTLLNNILSANCDACGSKRPIIPSQLPTNSTTSNIDDLSPRYEICKHLDSLSHGSRDNLINYSETFECPHLTCNLSFVSFDDFYRHMESHQKKVGNLF